MSLNSITCATCKEPIPGERAILDCGHSFHIKCALDHFSKLGSEDRRTCPSCHFQVNRFGHAYTVQIKPLSALGKDILCSVPNPGFVAPSSE